MSSTASARAVDGRDGRDHWIPTPRPGSAWRRDALSAAAPAAGERLPVRDRGKVPCHAMLMLAGGGECCADVEALRAEERLFGPVASDTTTWRVFRHELGPGVVAALRAAIAPVRHRVWARSSVTNTAEPVVLDIDATLVEVHSENKDDIADTYKRGFGFHPMFCIADATGEALAGRLRPGNAGANNAGDHLKVLDDAIAQLAARSLLAIVTATPRRWWSGQWWCGPTRPGARPGSSPGCRARNVGFAVVARSNKAITAAISRTYAETNDERWVPAVRQNGEVRPGAQVPELTDLVVPPKGLARRGPAGRAP